MGSREHSCASVLGRQIARSEVKYCRRKHGADNYGVFSKGERISESERFFNEDDHMNIRGPGSR